ncbi:hypothetical protein PsorP6_018955 [Peronosclerospora sorghi]|nr:hypothetical protein PsorP6_018955 [Peronosclerospora sorghi]
MARQAIKSTQIEAAIEVVQSGSMSLREAARKFAIPRTTLQRRVVQRKSWKVADSNATKRLAPTVVDVQVRSDTRNEDTVAVKQTECKEDAVVGRKHCASYLASPNQGPRKVINCKIRMLCTAAGSALDEHSNEMIKEGKCIYKLGLGQSPFPIPQCIVDELRLVMYAFLTHVG